MRRKTRLATAEAEHGSVYIITSWTRLLRMAATESDARDAALTAARQEHDYLYRGTEGHATTEALHGVQVRRVPFNTWVFPRMDGELIFGRERLTVGGQEGWVWRRIGSPVTGAERDEVRRQAAVNNLDRHAARPQRLPRAKPTSDALAITDSWVWTERPAGPFWGWKVAVFPTGAAAIAHTHPRQPIWGLRGDGAVNQLDGRGYTPLLRDGLGMAVR